MTKSSWKYIARKTFPEFADDQCLDLAAALTYYAVLSLFPALLALVSLLGLFGQQGKTDQLITVLSDMGAGSVADTIRAPLDQLAQNQSAGFALIIGVVGALWSASGCVGAFGRAMNRIYEIREGRRFWKLRPLMIVITLPRSFWPGWWPSAWSSRGRSPGRSVMRSVWARPPSQCGMC